MSGKHRLQNSWVNHNAVDLPKLSSVLECFVYNSERDVVNTVVILNVRYPRRRGVL